MPPAAMLPYKGQFAGEPARPSCPLCLWYTRPAKTWSEALPVGNGHVGAMIFGGVQHRADPVQRAHRLDRPAALLRPRRRGRSPARDAPPVAGDAEARARSPAARSRRKIEAGPREAQAGPRQAEGGRRPRHAGVHERAAASEGLPAVRRSLDRCARAQRRSTGYRRWLDLDTRHGRDRVSGRRRDLSAARCSRRIPTTLLVVRAHRRQAGPARLPSCGSPARTASRKPRRPAQRWCCAGQVEDGGIRFEIRAAGRGRRRHATPPKPTALRVDGRRRA